MDIKIDDIVLVSGKVIEAGKTEQTNWVLAKVLACGKHDVFLKKVGKNTGMYEKIFISSLKKCQKIQISNIDLSSERVFPEIGNLVMSLYNDFSKTNKHVGILEKICEIPGNTTTATIRSSDKKIIVPYDSLIVLE